jgi:pyruvate formate lyase activating enzyme
MKEALLQQPLPGGEVRCGVCQRKCAIAPGRVGYCRTRLNEAGRLHSLTYGRVASIAVSPIEKKPLFHYYPASNWLSLGSLGCNFRCPGCQNWEMAHADARKAPRATEYLSPEQVVRLARDRACLGISWTYNEPTLWLEYTLDSARLAREHGLLTNYVTNGFATKEALDLLGPWLDSFRVDLKGFSRTTYRRIAHITDFTGILDVIVRAKRHWAMHVELVTNIIPTYNDSLDELRRLAQWIARELGPDTPWHVTQFAPHLRLSHLPATAVETLERARRIGLEAGLHYVYLGNVWGHPAENTYCHCCGALLIERRGLRVAHNRLEGDRCPNCATEIPGRWTRSVVAGADRNGCRQSGG